MNERPTNKASLFNFNLPADGVGIIANPILALLDPGLLRIYICPSIAGVLSVLRTFRAVTVTELLNSGNALVAGAGYEFEVPWKTGESINLVYSTPSSTCTNGTGVATGSPIHLPNGTTTVVATGAGTFTVVVAAGCTGTATSGTATVVGSPQALVSGVNVVDTGITVGDFTILLAGATVIKLQIDEMWD
jgi:hypothetical protein